MRNPAFRIRPLCKSANVAACLTAPLIVLGLVASIARVAWPDGGGAQETDKKVADEIIAKYSIDVLPNPALGLARKNPKVVRRILESTRPEEERFAAYALYVESESPGFKSVILQGLKDRSERIRARAVHYLPKALSGKELVAEHVRLLGDPSHAVRYNAAEALGKNPSEDAIEPLLKLLADKSIEVRDRAAWTLLVWKLPSARKRVQELRDSPDPTVAGVANYALARFGEARIDLGAIHKYLRQELKALTGPPYSGTDHVVGILWVLRDRGDVNSLPVLQEATRHEHRSIREEAQKAVEEIKKRPRPVTEATKHAR